MTDLAKGFMALFAGQTSAYGEFVITGSRDSDGKLLGRATTIHKDVTEDLWISHLDGLKAIGIIPIRDDSTARFGTIDIDEYNLDHAKIVKDINTKGFPLILTKSKSGGAHLWLFVSSYVPAKLVQIKLRDMAAGLGFGRAEIFPKQSRVLPERGDLGNWISMPYFGTTKWAVDENGKSIPPKTFLALAKGNVVKSGSLGAIQAKKSPDIVDGPPCLQHLIAQGFPSGTRNKALYNLGVYAKKSSPDNWAKLVEQFNSWYMLPPLDTNEVQAVIKSLNKKDYQYQCNDAPCVNFCDAALCRSRKFGVGNNTGMPVITSLTKYNATPPVWFVDVEGGGRLELGTEDLQQQQRFQKACMESLNMMPPPMNKAAWQTMVQGLLENVNVIEAPVDVTPRGQLSELLEKFCTGRAQALVKNELILGKPWTNEGRHYFTMSGFLSFLERRRFKLLPIQAISSVIRNHLHGEHHFFNINGKGVNVWSVPSFTTIEELTLPDDLDREGPF